MRYQLEAAISSADVIGIYPPTNPDPLLNGTIPLLLKRSCYNNQALARAWVNYEWEEHNLFGNILRDQSIGVIGCRQVAPLLENRFKARVIRFYPATEEQQFVGVGENCTVQLPDPHYPEYFEQIKATLEVTPRPNLFNRRGPSGQTKRRNRAGCWQLI